MDDIRETERGHAAYLLQLQQELDSLERFPQSSYSQALILAVIVPVLVAGLFGFSLLPVPPYLLLPFVVLPGWTLVRRERSWRVAHRAISERIRLTERRRQRMGAAAEEAGEAPPTG